MDQSYSESDISLSPTQVLERLQVLRQLQLLQRGKLQKQHLQYQDPGDNSVNSSNLTEIVSHFSNSTSYNTFRSLLRSSHDTSTDHTPRLNTSDISQKVNERDLIDGVSVLNLSHESEFIVNSPISARSRVSAQSKSGSHKTSISSSNNNLESKLIKKISLDEMPILSPKKDFEAMVLEKLQTEKSIPKEASHQNTMPAIQKKAFLKRGEGMARFGLKKNDLIIQNTKSLPWRKKDPDSKPSQSSVAKESVKPKTNNKNIEVEILMTPQRSVLNVAKKSPEKLTNTVVTNNRPKKSVEIIEACDAQSCKNVQDSRRTSLNSNKNDNHTDKKPQKVQSSAKHPLISNKGKTWAAVLTKEQDDFLRQLKQSDYYKNFESPTKSIISDISCDENLSKLRQEREAAEQNMFELLENKVTHESFNLDNSFFNQFLRRTALELSGESTPLIMQKCLANNPNLLHIFPDVNHKKRNETSNSDVDTCNSDYTECCSDTCSSVSSCCSCKTVEETNNSPHHMQNNNTKKKPDTGQKLNANTKKNKPDVEVDSKNDAVLENDIKANMAEMNAKLIATSELLKDRLRELEDEIETFRKENANLAKMREEIDLERQKFYEEKAALEQKFNEDKILSEYYLAEEKEKLSKQKQMYDKYVREMRGRLNKKDKDEVINLKKEISDLKEEIRIKDAKSTSTIARLRNQIKLMEKEKKESHDEIEKLKKENRRIQHSNDITRRLTNIKYLEQINKKLTHMSTQNTQSEVHLDPDVKYKAFEIERQSRSRKVQPVNQNVRRPRAKSVPNLKVTSRYAKYFSQRDTVSQMEKNKTLNEGVGTFTYPSDNEDMDDNDGSIDNIDKNLSDNEEDNYLEKMYLQRFQSNSPKSSRSSLSNSNGSHSITDINEIDKSNGFFIQKSASNSSRDLKLPDKKSASINSSNGSQRVSPISIFSCRSSNMNKSPSNEQNSIEYTPKLLGLSNNLVNRTKSPVSILSNRSSGNERLTNVINNDQYRDKLMTISPEPLSSKSSISKTNLNPTEVRKPDGTRELRFPNGNIKYISADGKYSKFVYYNGDVKENFYNEGRIKYFYAETKTFHTTHADGLEVLEFPDGQVEKRYKDGSSEIRLPNGSIRYFDPKNEHVREEWRFPDGAALTVSANGEQRIVFSNGQVEVHAKDHKRREFPDGTVKLVYTDGTSETRYASGRVRIKDKHGNLIMDSAPG